MVERRSQVRETAQLANTREIGPPKSLQRWFFTVSAVRRHPKVEQRRRAISRKSTGAARQICEERDAYPKGTARSSRDRVPKASFRDGLTTPPSPAPRTHPFATTTNRQLKVKPRKTAHVQPCALELTNMLSCWASSGDLASSTACRDAAARLQECMRKPVRLNPLALLDERGTNTWSLHAPPHEQQAKGKPRVSSINYLLARTNAQR